jgi:hypothetical protein
MRIDSTTAESLQPWFPSLALDRVQIVHEGPMCWFVRNVLRQGAMTIAPYIFYGRSRFDPARLGSVALLAHELKHVQQYQEKGHVRFLARYFWDLGRNRFQYSKTLPLEKEAYDLQAEVERALRSRFAPPIV